MDIHRGRDGRTAEQGSGRSQLLGCLAALPKHLMPSYADFPVLKQAGRLDIKIGVSDMNPSRMLMATTGITQQQGLSVGRSY